MFVLFKEGPLPITKHLSPLCIPLKSSNGGEKVESMNLLGLRTNKSKSRNLARARKLNISHIKVKEIEID